MRRRKKIDLHDLLSKHDFALIAEVVLDCLGSIDIYPEVWELKIEALIDSHQEEKTT